MITQALRQIEEVYDRFEKQASESAQMREVYFFVRANYLKSIHFC